MTDENSKRIFRAKNGDVHAFGELYEQSYRELYRYALYYLGNREEAEDAVQETALEAFRGIAQLKKETAFRSWLFAILDAWCKRHVAELIRLRNQTDITELDIAIEGGSAQQEQAILLWQLIAALDEEDRQLVLLSVVGGFSGKEIAALLHRPEGTLRSRLHRTLKKLRSQLEETEKEGDDHGKA